MSLFPSVRRQPVTADVVPFEQWLGEFFDDVPRWQRPGQDGRLFPRADVAETDKELVVAMEVPGMEEGDLQVRITGNQLVVSGERKQRKEDKDKHWCRVETTFGAFERRFELPAEVRKDGEGVRATLQKGMIEIRVPKIEPRPAAKIPIKAG